LRKIELQQIYFRVVFDVFVAHVFRITRLHYLLRQVYLQCTSSY